MGFIGFIISMAVSLYCFVIILQVAISWLVAFEIVNANNEAAKNLTALLKKLTDPVYTPLRKYVPPIGGIDIVPLIVLVGVQIFGGILASLFY